MKKLKKYLGVIWMLAGPIAIFILFRTAIQHINAGGTADINKPIPWIIILVIFTPVAAGLSVFGWYAWTDEYDSDRKRG
jgi:Zn-dependent protease with chaperone function